MPEFEVWQDGHSWVVVDRQAIRVFRGSKVDCLIEAASRNLAEGN